MSQNESEYKIQHRLIGSNGEECEVYTEIIATSKENAREIFLSNHISRLEYWDVEIDNIIEKKYS